MKKLASRQSTDLKIFLLQTSDLINKFRVWKRDFAVTHVVQISSWQLNSWIHSRLNKCLHTTCWFSPETHKHRIYCICLNAFKSKTDSFGPHFSFVPLTHVCACSQTQHVNHLSCYRWVLALAVRVSSSFPSVVSGRLLLSYSDRFSLQQMPNTTAEFWLPVCRAAQEYCPKPIKHRIQNQNKKKILIFKDILNQIQFIYKHFYYWNTGYNLCDLLWQYYTLQIPALIKKTVFHKMLVHSDWQ